MFIAGTLVTLALAASVSEGASPARSPSPLLITLALDRDRTLPGLPVGLRFVAFNRSVSAADMPAPFALEIVPPNGEPFLGFWPNENYRWGSIPAEYQGHFSVPPQESREYLITPGDQMTSPAGLLTRHLFTPGTYRLRAGFLPGISEKIDGALEQAHTIAELQAEVAGVVATNEVELHIDPPAGDDLAVWNLILERLGAGGWSGMPDVRKRSALAREVWDRYPRSQYAPHMIGVLVPKAGETREMIRQQIASLDAHHPMLDWFDLGRAERDALNAGSAVTAERDLSKSLRLAQQARDELAALIQRTNNEVIRLAAQRVVVWTDEDIVIKDRIYSRNDPPPPETSEPVTPFVTCSSTTLGATRTRTPTK